MVEFAPKFIGYVAYTNNGVSLDINELVTHNSAILGVLGSGKSCLALEFVERILKAGIKVICIDLSGQYRDELAGLYSPQLDDNLISDFAKIGPLGKTNSSPIKEESGSIKRFEDTLKAHYLTSLRDSEPNLRIFDPSQFEVWALRHWIFKTGTPVMSQLTYPEIVSKLTKVIFDIVRQFGRTKDARCCIVYEEAHSLIPEFGSDQAAVSETSGAILQGRKFGLGSLVVTQRTANVAKSILNQCNTIFSLRVFDNTAMEFLENYFGKDYASSLSSLEDRHAVLYGLASSCQVPIQIKLNERENFLRVFRQNQAGSV